MSNKLFEDEIKPMSLEEMFEELNNKNVKIRVQSNEESTAYFMKDLETEKLYCVSLKLNEEMIE